MKETVTICLSLGVICLGSPSICAENMLSTKRMRNGGEEMPRTAAARERGGRSRGGKEEGGREMKQETVLNESNEMRLLRLDALGFETGKDRMIFVVSSSGFYIHPGSYRWS
jgi:hypothetical protein